MFFSTLFYIIFSAPKGNPIGFAFVFLPGSLFAGLGTLLFHLITGRKVPAFLGSSFAFLGGYAAIAPMIDGQANTQMLPYACFGVACAGLVYVILAGLFKAFGAKKVMRYFPPIVTGPMIIMMP